MAEAENSSINVVHLTLGVIVVSILSGVFGYWWFGRHPQQIIPDPVRYRPSPDPRLTYKGPYQNVHPKVRYVGSKACDECHLEEAEQFHHHPMGRSTLPLAQYRHDARFDEPPAFRVGNTRYQLVEKEGRFWDTQTILDGDKPLERVETELHYVVGSGKKGFSFFHTRDTALFQTSISYFSQKDQWGLSPGFSHARLRPITAECVYCHANQSTPIEPTENLFEKPILSGPAIGCERCHGPGEAHVKKWKGDASPPSGKDYSIVNPKDLDPDLREGICQQCHLEGENRIERRGRSEYEFRPGLPIEDFFAVFVPTETNQDKQKSVRQVELMMASRCYTGSKGKLGCISCHDAHEPIGPDKRFTFYRERCLDCHAEANLCSESMPTRFLQHDSCIDCHMQRIASANVPHTAATDHRVPKRANKDFSALARRDPSSWQAPLVDLFEDRHDDNPYRERDLGIALAKLGKTEPKYSEYSTMAVRLLKRATERDSQDHRALLALGEAYNASRQFPRSLPVLQRARTLRPKDQAISMELAVALEGNSRWDDALRVRKRLVETNPHSVSNLVLLAVIQAGKGDDRSALDSARRAGAIDPNDANARIVRALCLERLGGSARAEKQWKIAQALATPQSKQFERLVRKHLTR